MLDLFSINETLEDIHDPNNLKYLLLPALLGDLQAKLKHELQERAKILEIQEVYYQDFLKRCAKMEFKGEQREVRMKEFLLSGFTLFATFY